MPWTAKRDPQMCSASKPWAVLALDDGELFGCHATQDEAEDQVAALYAQEGGRPGEYNNQTHPLREVTMTDPIQAGGVTFNVNTFPQITDTQLMRSIIRTYNTATLPVRRDAVLQTEISEEDEDEVEETEPEPEPESDPEETPDGTEEENAEESEEDGPEQEIDPEEAELHGDREAARSRVRHVPHATRRVTDQVSNDCRGLPPGVLERLRDLKADVGVIDRVGRGTAELRFRPEFRLNRDGSVFLHGYATVYDFPYDVAGGPPLGWSETIVRDACSVSVNQRADVRLLINHEGIPLARTKSGTLKLESDDVGLYSAASSLDPRSPTVQSLMSALARGDLDEMSFAFKVKEQEWNQDYTERQITEVMLFDVSVVTYPANPATVVASARSAGPTSARSVPLAEAMLALRQSQVRGDRLRGRP